jgi:hypothetical protein
LSVFSNLVSVPRIRKSTLSSVVRFLSPFSFRSVSFPSSSQSSSLRIRLDIFNVFLTISSIHSNPSPPCLSAVSTFVLVSISSMSSLQYRRYTLIRLLPPLLLSRLHLRTRLDIHVNVFLQYRRYALQFRSFPLSSPPFPLHFRRQFQLFISSPSSMYPRTPLPSTLNTSRFPLGASSVSIHLSQCRLLCPCVSYADVCVTVLGTLFLSSSSFRLLAVSAFFSLPLFNTYVESVLSMQFYSVRSQALGLVESVPAFTFSPTFRRRPDVHLSLTSGWVHLGLNSCRIQTVCLHLIGSVLMFSPIVLSLSFWLLAVSHRSCAILFSFSFLVFNSSSSGFSFLVPRFQLLVFIYLSSGLAFLVPRSQFDTTALLSQSIYTFFSSFTLSFTLPSVGSSSLSSFLPLDVMTFTSC